MSRLGFTVLLILTPWLALAQHATQQAAEDVQELVFFGSTCPVRLRLHLRLDGQPYRAAWEAYLGQLFDYLDQDGDGVLDEDEVARAPRPQLLQRQLRGEVGATEMMVRKPRRPELEVKLQGGKVKRQGLATYYRLAGLQAFIVAAQERDPDSDRLTDALLRLLDTNGDGKLAKDELRAAAAVLRKLDADENEVITPEEILPPLDPERDATARRQRNLQGRLDDAVFFVLGDEDAERIPYRFLALYDKNKDEKLTPAELGFPKEVFAGLDANQDGKLDVAELVGWLKRPPDVELTVRLGRRGDTEPALEVPGGAGFKALGGVLRDGALSLAPEDARLDLRVLTGPSAAFEDLRRTLTDQFLGADTDANQYLDERESERVPVFQQVFVSADTDGDGKLTVKEFDAYLDVQAKAASGSTSLSIRDHGRALFATLDANGDGRLGPRELRSVWARLAMLDRDGDGSLTLEELPRQFHLLLAQGPPAAAMMTEQPRAETARSTRPTPAAGPLWFRKMDRNGDGDVSRREFPGTTAAFTQLDANGDELISVAEAERADEKLRGRR